MNTPKIPFKPLIQPNDALSGVQKYLLRVIFGWAGKTILYRERVVEVIETHGSLRQLLPLVESDLSESNANPFWIQDARVTASDSTLSVGTRADAIGRLHCLGRLKTNTCPMPNAAQCVSPPSYLHYLVTKLGYSLDAALAAFARPQKIQGLPDRRRAVAFNSDEHSSGRRTRAINESTTATTRISRSPSRRTLTGGCSRRAGAPSLSKMRAGGRVGQALFEIVLQTPLDQKGSRGVQSDAREFVRGMRQIAQAHTSRFATAEKILRPNFK